MLSLVQVATVLVKLTCLAEHVQRLRVGVALVLPVVTRRTLFNEQYLQPWGEPISYSAKDA